MTRPIMGYLAGAAFVLSVAGAATAYAQAAPPAPAPSDREHGQHIERQVIIKDGDGHVTIQRGGEGGHEMMRPDLMPHEGGNARYMIMRHDDGAGHADHLRTMLQLKPGQEAALTAYLAATGPQRRERIVEMSDHAAPKTTPQRLSEMESRMAEDAARSKVRIEATRKFYDQLEPSQKKVFDEMPMLMGPMMMHGDGMKVMVSTHDTPPLPPLPPRPPRAPVAPTPHS